MTKINPIKKAIAWTLGTVSKTKPMEGLKNNYQKRYDSALAATAVASIVLKDTQGGIKYVTQSMNNEEIPDDKRPFVTSMDFANSIIMITTQIGMFFLMRKYSGKIFNSIFKKSFSENAKENMLTRLRMACAKHSKELRKIEASKIFESQKDDALNLFKFVFDVGVATIIGKRILTPLIATPVAKVVEKNVYPILVGERKLFGNKEKPQAEENQADKEDLTAQEA